MPTKRCCCVCYTFEDDFERPDSTDIGNAWSECSGDWFIESGRLIINESGYVVLEKMVGNPYGILTTKSLYADVVTNIGAKYRWYVYKGTQPTPCSGTVDHWLFEMEVMTSYEGILRVYEYGVLMVERQIVFQGNELTGGEFELSICVSDDVISASSPDMGLGVPAWFCPNNPEDFYFALGSAGTGLVAFSWVGYSDEYNHDPTCPSCERGCCCPCIEADNNRPTLRVEIYAPDCPHMHGVSTTITCSAPPNECCIWTGPPLVFQCPDDDEFCDPLGEPFTYELTPIMQCAVFTEESDPCSGYRLTLNWTPGSDNFKSCLYYGDGIEDDLQSQEKTVGDCNCNPLLLQFDGYTLRRNPANLQNCCVCCGVFSIIVTEVA